MFFLKFRIFSSSKCLPLIKRISSGIGTNNDNIPIIQIPKYIENNRGNTRYKEYKKLNEANAKRSNFKKLNSEHSNKLIISSNNNRKLNHYYGYRYNINNVPLISKEWLKQRTNGSEMTFHRFDDNPSFLQHDSIKFSDLGLKPIIIDALRGLIPASPSLIQAGAIPSILKNRNLIFSAETGSGKTIAYLAPLIQMIHEEKTVHSNSKKNGKIEPYGMVLLPSRELTEQIGNVAKKLSELPVVGVKTIIGGLSKGLEHTGTDLIITTIGMVQLLLSKGVINFSKLKHLVLDEADTLLDDTFSDEITDLLDNIKLLTEEDINGVQLICCSATTPTGLKSKIGNYIDVESDIDHVTTTQLHSLHPNVKHNFYRVHKYDKEVKIIEILKKNIKKPTIIFGNRTNGVNWLYHYLNENGFTCVRLTSNMEEEERYHSFRQFQNGDINILVSTDLGSRGLDTTRARHIINYDCPHYVSDYIHRAGRTGRLGMTEGLGFVSTLVSFKPDAIMLMNLEKSIRLNQEITCVDANIRSQLQAKWADKAEKMKRNH